jgi:hypothetical protein
MRQSSRCAVLMVAGLAATVPAMAQFGGIFGPPPRPPGNIPSQQPYDQQRTYEPQPPAQPRYQPQYEPPPQYPPSPQYPPPQTSAAPNVGPPGQGNIRSDTLPPPPGAAVDQRAAVPPTAPPPGTPPAPQPGIPPGATPAVAPNAPPGSRAPATATAPVDTTLQPGDEVVTEPPAQKIVNPTAVFSGLDKITGRITSFDVAVNETVQFGALQVTPRVCYTRPPTEAPRTDAFVEVDEVTLQGEIKRIFTGWMFAASPGLHAVEHPIYDVWLTNCKGGGPPPVAEAQPAPPAPAHPTKPPPRPRRPAPRAQVQPPPPR